MSVTSYYGRLTEHQYQDMRDDPDGLAQFVTGALPKENLLYLDKAAPVIAWLLSPLKRHEQAHFAAVCRAEDLDNFHKPELGPEPPMDEILIPLEGRGEKDERLDVGMGPACVISTSEAKRFAEKLAAIGESELRQRLSLAPRRFVWNPTVRIAGRRRARWACGQAAFEPVHMSTGHLPGARI